VEIHPAVSGEVEAGGSGEEVVGLPDAIADNEGSGGVLGTFVAHAFVSEDASNEWGEWSEDGEGDDAAVL